MNVKRVILIDDDTDDLAIITELLHQVDSRCQCMSFQYADDALTLLKKELIEIPDYIFIDINMPRISGEECLIDLRKLKNLSSTQIIMNSTSMPDNISKKLLANGASYTFQKPVLIKEYLKLLENVIYGNVTN